MNSHAPVTVPLLKIHAYLVSGVDIRNDEQGKNTEKSIFSLVEPSSS